MYDSLSSRPAGQPRRWSYIVCFHFRFHTGVVQEHLEPLLVYPQQGDCSSGPPSKTQVRASRLGSSFDPHAHDINAMVAPKRGGHARLRVSDDPPILLEYDILATFGEADYAENGT